MKNKKLNLRSLYETIQDTFLIGGNLVGWSIVGLAALKMLLSPASAGAVQEYTNPQPTPQALTYKIPKNALENQVYLAPINKEELEQRPEEKSRGLERKVKSTPKTLAEPTTKPSTEPTTKPKYTPAEYQEMSKILYAEAADQSRQNRRLIARTILNRVASSKYPDSIDSVIHQRNAFTCTFDGKKNWAQATGRRKMNGYEKMIFRRCTEDAQSVLDGTKEEVEIPREDEIIAYHDISIKKPRDKYWKSLVEVHRSGRLIFYAPKTKK